MTFKAYAEEWLAVQTFEESTRDAVALRLRKHILPALGNRELRAIKPSTIQALLRDLDHLAPRTRGVILTNLSTILSAAVDDELIVKNPCNARSVSKPRPDAKPIVPWNVEDVHGVHDTMPERYQIAVSLGAGLGLRQGEIFGLAADDVDFLRGFVTVRRQVKLYSDGRLEFRYRRAARCGQCRCQAMFETSSPLTWRCDPRSPWHYRVRSTRCRSCSPLVNAPRWPAPTSIAMCGRRR